MYVYIYIYIYMYIYRYMCIHKYNLIFKGVGFAWSRALVTRRHSSTHQPLSGKLSTSGNYIAKTRTSPSGTLVARAQKQGARMQT